MKTLYLFAIALLLIGTSACKKNKDPRNGSESQGVKFNLLLKTVTKVSTAGREIITEYAYNAAGQLSEIKTTDNVSAGTPVTVETFYRNAAGRTDSIAYSGKINGVVSIVSKTIFKYDLSGKLIFSSQNYNNFTNPPAKDSSAYAYTGSVLKERTDYRSFDGGLTYNLLRQATYEFDASGNISKSIFKWATNAISDTLSFQYDNKINPIPNWPSARFFYWAPLFYNDFKHLNNLTQTIAKNVDSYSYFDYNYTPNNKPLYRKEKPEGASANFDETYYYYD